jgi:phage-related holin
MVTPANSRYRFALLLECAILSSTRSYFNVGLHMIFSIVVIDYITSQSIALWSWKIEFRDTYITLTRLCRDIRPLYYRDAS